MSAVATADPRAEPRELPPPNPPAGRWTRFILPAYTILMILYLASPILVMILYGFNDVQGVRPTQTPRFSGFTLNWWKNIFTPQGLEEAFKNSLIVAPVSAAVATVLGTLFGLAIGRYRFRGLMAVDFVIFLAIAVPEIVLGSSLLSMFVQIDFPLGLRSILLSHIGFSIAFVAVTVRARVQGLDRSLEEAAQDLFATPIVGFFKVTLPLIAPSILAGFLLAFVLSLDDFVITNFVAGQTNTFPLWVFGAQRIGIPPQVNVIGTILFMAGILAAAGNVLVHRRRT
ncbi:MAG TPA: ABC transporter permease [Actinomycetota bacterium]|nr:ABC transporter permease [Actinomycetota bacterium]